MPFLKNTDMKSHRKGCERFNFRFCNECLCKVCENEECELKFYDKWCVAKLKCTAYRDWVKDMVGYKQLITDK